MLALPRPLRLERADDASSGSQLHWDDERAFRGTRAPAVGQFSGAAALMD